jgi:hypothetical protein
MPRTLGAALGVALLTFGPTATDQSAPPAPQAAVTGKAAISGVVTDAVTGSPIAGASVTLLPFQPESQGRLVVPPAVLTDARGRFVLTDLPSAPRYSLIATYTGYDVGHYGGADSAGGSVEIISTDSASIKLADGEWMRDANIRMWRFGSIGGRVVDERGEPVVGAAVRAFSRQVVAGHQQLVQGPVATTDDRGIYRLPFLRPGGYFIAVLSVQATVPASTPDGPRGLPLGGLEGRGRSTPPSSRTEARGAGIDVDGRHRLVLTSFATPPPPGADRPRAYPPVFYPNGRTVNEAQAVQLQIGTSRSDVDFQLAPVPTATVSGGVTGAVQGAANMLLRLMAPGAEHLGFGAEAATTLVEADGTFTFLNVPAGTYTLVASPGVAEVTGGSSAGRLPRTVGYGPAQGLSISYPAAPGVNYMWWQAQAGSSVWGRLPVGVGAADVTGLDLALHAATSVRGRVVFDDPEQPDPNQRFMVGLEPANADPLLGAPNAWTTAGDTSHAFAIGGLQGGRYLLRLQRFGGWRTRSVTANGVDVTDSGFDGALGLDYDDVVVTVTKTGAALSGIVLDHRGQPAAGAVMLFPLDPRQWVDYGLTPDRLRTTRAGADGAYKLTLLRDGEYHVVAVPMGQANAWLDPQFLAAAAAQATRVSLAPDATKTQDLRLSEVIVR